MANIGDRLRAERTRSGKSLRQLAEEVGIHHTILSRMETGDRRVASDELFTLAEALGTTTGALLGRPGRSLALAVAGRLGSDVHEDFLEPAVGRVTQLLEMDDLLDRVAGPGPAVVVPAVPKPIGGSALVQGRALAKAAREALGLGVGPVGDMRSLLEDRFGVYLVAQPIAGNVHGLCVNAGGTSVVLVNTRDRWGRQRWTYAHELAHLLMGDLEAYEITWSGADTTSEKRADAFAAHFLAPQEGLRAFVAGRKVDQAVLADVMEYFGLSRDAACWRLINSRLLSDSDAGELRAEGARTIVAAADLLDAYDRHADEFEQRVVVPERLFRRAVDAYEAGNVGVGVVAAVLGSTDLADVRRRLESKGIHPPALEVQAVSELI